MPIVDLWQCLQAISDYSNLMHPLSGVLPLPSVPARVTHCALVAHIGTRLRLRAVELPSPV